MKAFPSSLSLSHPVPDPQSSNYTSFSWCGPPQMLCVWSRSYVFLSPRFYASGSMLQTALHLAFFHLAKYLKEPSISYLYWPHWLPSSLFSGVHFYKNYVIHFLVHKIKGMCFRHGLNMLDFSDFPAFSKLGGKGPAPSRHRKNDRRELTSYTLYKKRNSSHWKNRRKTSTTTKSH